MKTCDISTPPAPPGCKVSLCFYRDVILCFYRDFFDAHTTVWPNRATVVNARIRVEIN